MFSEKCVHERVAVARQQGRLLRSQKVAEVTETQTPHHTSTLEDAATPGNAQAPSSNVPSLPFLKEGVISMI